MKVPIDETRAFVFLGHGHGRNDARSRNKSRACIILGFLDPPRKYAPRVYSRENLRRRETIARFPNRRSVSSNGIGRDSSLIYYTAVSHSQMTRLAYPLPVSDQFNFLSPSRAASSLSFLLGMARLASDGSFAGERVPRSVADNSDNLIETNRETRETGN